MESRDENPTPKPVIRVESEDIYAEMEKMQGVNPYAHRLSRQNLSAREHRRAVGGMWEELGQLQYDFLVAQGLQPDHKLLDVGCGALRGGIHFIEYLDAGNYYGIDVSLPLLEGGVMEIEKAGLNHKLPNLMAVGDFEMWRFGETFDFLLAQSVFTHLFMNHIVQCLVQAKKVLKPSGKFFATFFETAHPGWIKDIQHEYGGVTHYAANPFHCSFEEIEMLAAIAGLSAAYIGDWRHPRGQKMVCFSP